MSLGLGSKFSILRQSPHDLEPAEPASPAAPLAAGEAHWVPSRYNIRATTADGSLVVWNSFTGAMSVFEAAKKQGLEEMLSRKGFAARPEGAVKYLFERGYLVKEGTDEYRRIQLGFGQQQYRTDTLELILLASEDCNFRCEYCYEEFARGTMQPWVRAAVKQLVEKRLDRLRTLSVSWFGGEPLYGFPAIEELAPFFLATAAARGLRYSASMTTNGYLLTPEVAGKLLSWKISSFQITVDGPPEDHDRNRPTRDGQGTFATIFANLKAMRRLAEEFAIDLRFNFDRQNSRHVTPFLDLFQSEFAGDPRFKLRFRAVGQWGGPNDEQLDVCGRDEARNLKAEMRREARRRGLSLSDSIVGAGGLGTQVCYAARPYNFIVGASGKLMKCTIDLDRHDRNVVGRLTETGDLDVDQDKLALWTEPAFEKDAKCQKCVVLPACQGVFCPQIRIESGESPCTPLRMGGKRELLEAVEDKLRTARRVAVSSGEGPRAGSPAST